jgi:hypothetical protein
MMTDLYLLQGMSWRGVARKLERTTQVPMSIWQVGRGANSCVAVQYEGNRWVESEKVKDAVKALARDHNLALNINMEQYR